jgi:hypothetical protein
MSVETEASALSMPASINSLESTPLVMHRIWFDLRDTQTWYAIMKEATAMYGKDGWKGQPRVKRRLERFAWQRNREENLVWFEVPDPAFATWCAVKHAVIVVKVPGK